MAARARTLRVVEQDPPPGDPSLTQQTVASWTPGQRKCRARKRHNWGPYTVMTHPTFFDVVERCTHCSNRRHADYSATGRKLTDWKPDYREGYLLPKGAQRLDEETHDELMLGDLLSRKQVAAPDDDEADDLATARRWRVSNAR